MNPEGVSADVAAEQFEALMTDDGALPGDVDYVEPEPKVEPEEPVVEGEPEVEPEVEETEDAPEEAEEVEDEGDEPVVSPISDDTLVDIDIDGEAYEVNLTELKSGYLRQEEFTKRVTELEQKASEFQEQVSEREVALQRELEMAQVILAGDLSKYDKVDWEQLKTDDPATYQRLRLEAIDAKESLQGLQNRRNQIQSLHEEAQKIKQAVHVKAQIELATKLMPEFKEATFRDGLIKYGKDIGYTEDELYSMTDARQLLLLNQARLYAEGQVRRKEAVAKKATKELPPVVKAGAPKAKGSESKQAIKLASARFAKDHSVESAAALFEQTVNFD